MLKNGWKLLTGNRTDTQILNYLDAITDSDGRIRLEVSKQGRGWALRQSQKGKTYGSVREAVVAVMKGGDSEPL